MRRRTAIRAAITCLLLLPLSVLAIEPAAYTGPLRLVDQPTPPVPKVYIVQMRREPVIAYKGGLANLPSTKPFAGECLDRDDSSVRQYADFLTADHDRLLGGIGASQNKLYSYCYSFNGFAAHLEPAQVAALRKRPDIVQVWEDTERTLQTNNSARFLGLLEQNVGLRSALKLRGDGIIIGVIDSGISPQHPRFSDRFEANIPRLCRSTWAESSFLGIWLCRRYRNLEGGVAYDPPPDWNGTCQVSERFASEDCNNKLIGARFYSEGFLNTGELDAGEFLSPRDADGHGTHIASTVAGNEVEASLFGTKVGRVAGMAPRAYIAAYKACWLRPGATRATCSTSDLARAIDDAVADGVDVINYSVGSTAITFNAPDDIALLFAADAGVFTAVAAGNNGPGAQTIGAPSGVPWVLTVGASTLDGQRSQEAIEITTPAELAGQYVVKGGGLYALAPRAGCA